MLHKEPLTWSSWSRPPARLAGALFLLRLVVGCAPAGDGAAPELRGNDAPWPRGPETSATGPSTSGLPSVETSATGLAAPGRGEAANAAIPSLRPTRELPPIDLLPPSHPLAPFDDTALAVLIRQGSAELGSVSVGQPNRGRLLNGVQMPEGPLWRIEEPQNAWGTQETVESIQRAIARVEEDHPGSPPLHIGHLSRRTGGWLRPHRSHQSGRDVDLGYYYLEGPRWYAPATAENLDRARTWSLLMGLLTQGNVEYVFMTRNVQELLLEHARTQGVDEEWLAELFDAVPRARAPRGGKQSGARPNASQRPEPLIRHRSGHHTHLHVRFYSDTACATGRRTFHLLRKLGKI